MIKEFKWTQSSLTQVRGIFPILSLISSLYASLMPQEISLEEKFFAVLIAWLFQGTLESVILVLQIGKTRGYTEQMLNNFKLKRRYTLSEINFPFSQVLIISWCLLRPECTEITQNNWVKKQEWKGTSLIIIKIFTTGNRYERSMELIQTYLTLLWFILLDFSDLACVAMEGLWQLCVSKQVYLFKNHHGIAHLISYSILSLFCITFICTERPKYSCNLLYCNIHFIAVVWNWTYNISEVCLYSFL